MRRWPRAAAGREVTVASDQWVLLYYRVPWRWDGRRVAHRPAAGVQG